MRAVGFTGNSGHSNIATATTSVIDAPAAPSTLVATLSGSSVQLVWIDNSVDESQFAIERCAGAGCSAFTQISAVGANITRSLDRAVVGGQSYSYRVWASKSGANSDYSNVATVTTPLAVPGRAGEALKTRIPLNPGGAGSSARPARIALELADRRI